MTTKENTPDGKEDTTEAEPIIIAEPPIEEDDTQILTPETSPEQNVGEPEPKLLDEDEQQSGIMVQVIPNAPMQAYRGRWGFTKRKLIGSGNWIVQFEDGEEPATGVLRPRELIRVQLS